MGSKGVSIERNLNGVVMLVNGVPSVKQTELCLACAVSRPLLGGRRRKAKRGMTYYFSVYI